MGDKQDKRRYHRATGTARAARAAASARRRGTGSFRRSGWRRCGNAIIETAIGLQVLTFAALGMFEFGQFMYIKNAFESAARDAGRAATLPSATQATLYAAATATLRQANVTFSNGWLSMQDLDNSNATVSDIATIASPHRVQLTISTTYDTIPNACRPLNSITGGRWGIKTGKTIAGQVVVVRE